MLKKLTLENFGPHQNIVVNLAPYTVVTGTNDLGKSWLIPRAINWCLYNIGGYHDDDDKDEIRYGVLPNPKAPFVKVRIDLTDGRWIERHRAKKVNKYTIFDGTETHEFMNFGQGFLPAVGDLLGIRPVALDGANTEIVNVRNFGDPPFLLTKSPAQIDQILSRLMGGDIWEDALKLIEKDLRDGEKAVKSGKTKVEELDEKLSQFEVLDDASRVLQQAQGLFAKATEATERKARIKTLQEHVVQQRALHATAKQRASVCAAVAEAVMTLSDSCEAASKTRSAVIAVSSATVSIERSRRKAQVCTLIADTVIATTDDSTEIAQRRAKLLSATWRVEEATSALATGKDKHTELVNEAGKAESSVEQTLQKAGHCPLCLQPIPCEHAI